MPTDNTRKSLDYPETNHGETNYALPIRLSYLCQKIPLEDSILCTENLQHYADLS
jgi:hypothetical protein